MQNLIGKKFSQLKVISYLKQDKHRHQFWLCKCDCGNLCSIRDDRLKNSKTKSCGCLNSQIHTSHGLAYHPLYSIWYGIKTRIFNTKAKDYKHYGGRGIKICDEWRDDFKTFKEALNCKKKNNL